MGRKITKNILIGAWGFAVCFLAVIVAICPNTFLSFISTGLTAAFGFMGFWVIVPFVFITGLSMIFHKYLTKFKFGISMWGILIIIVAFVILTSHWGSINQVVDTRLVLDGFTKDPAYGTPKYITFDKFYSYYTQIAASVKYSPYSPVSGGGFVGYLLLGLLNSLITPYGMIAFSWVLIVVGLGLCFHRPIKKLFKKIFGKKQKKPVSIEPEYIAPKETIEVEQIVPTPEVINNTPSVVSPFETDSVTRDMMADLSLKNSSSSYGLRKPILVLADETQSNQPAAYVSPQPSEIKPLIELPEVDNPLVSEKEEISTQEENINFVNEETEEQVKENLEPIFEEPPTLEEITPKEPMFEEPVEVEEIANPLVSSEPVAVEPPVDFLHKPQPKVIIRPPYVFPSLDLLDCHEKESDAEANNESCQARVELINQIFSDLHVGAEVTGYTVGPSVTRYDVQTKGNVSVTQVGRFVDDISVRLGGVPTRFEPIVFGKPTSGLEVPNAVRTNVGLREAIDALPIGDKFLCTIPFGKNISGDLIKADMREFPHLLVAGTTGSGKSIFMHSMIMTLIMRNTPSQLKLILIDPKKVEMSYYKGIPHLLCPNVNDPRKALLVFKKLTDEMERRYNLFEANGCRDIKTFNYFANEHGLEPLPVIVVFIDEYADLSDQCADLRAPVVRIAQKARACGIHLVVATQRPSVDVIDGVIKANIGSHVALMVASAVDSKTIIGEGGAESLLGNGDMLIDCPLVSRKAKARVQGCFVDIPEIQRVCDFLRSHYGEQYDEEFLNLEEKQPEYESNSCPEIKIDKKELADEELYKIIKTDIVQREYCSISYLTRAYGMGFPKAGRMFSKLVNDGYVENHGDARGSKVLIHRIDEQQNGSIEQSEFIPNSMLSQSESTDSLLSEEMNNTLDKPEGEF